MSDRYFQLNDDVGLDHETGDLAVIQEIGVRVSSPILADPKNRKSEIVELGQTIIVKPIPATRIVKVDDPRVVAGLLETGFVHEIDPPDEATLKAARSATAKHRELDKKRTADAAGKED
jgi:hypothetical protein